MSTSNTSFRDRLTRSYPEDLLQKAEQAARPNIQIRLQKGISDDDIAIGRSKYWGCPDVPPDFVWPMSKSGHPLAFLMQIDFADLVNLHDGKLLPQSGRAYFFYDMYEYPWGDVEEFGMWKFIYSEASTSQLFRHPLPAN